MRNVARSTRMTLAGAVALVSIGAVLPTADATEVEGKEIYAKKCALCHGKDARGNEQLAQLWDVDQGLLDLLKKDSLAKDVAAWRETIVKGRGRMPPQGKILDKEEIDQVIAFVRSLASHSATEGGQEKGGP